MIEQTVNTDKVDRKSIAKMIKDRAENSKVFNAICHVFALRERTRQQVTIHSLSVTMQKEGFDFSRSDYMKELDFLASLNLGRIEKSRTGVIRALKDITVTLQSIGAVGVGKKAFLDKSQVLGIKRVRKAAKAPVVTPKVNHKRRLTDNATLVLTIDGRRMALTLEPNISASDLLTLIFKMAAVPGGI